VNEAASGGKASFPPEAAPDARLLILGSLPGEVSLAKAQYYAHPQNQFWRLIGAVIGFDLIALAYSDRLAALKSARVALWDVVRTAQRRGSLDADIRGHQPNPLAELAASLPDLRAVGFNGATSWKLGAPLLAGDARLMLIPLPSSSPAYTIGFERKLSGWIELKAFLGETSFALP
jgi:TDG/mug DNA glycosylase family protein